jgi:C_GCAxxG_C_C family probable redox protein
MDKKEKAIKLYEGGCNCSQAILMAFAEDYNFDKKLAESLATPFGSGMSGEKKTCGCLSGALMVIGLEYGSDSMTNRDNRKRAYTAGKDFYTKFEETFEASDCKDLIELSLKREEGSENTAQKVSSHRCKNLVAATAELLEHYLKQEGEI